MHPTSFRLQALLCAWFQRSAGFSVAVLMVAALAAAFCQPARAQATICASDPLPNGDGQHDLVVIGTCHVKAGTYKYKNVNVVVSKSGSVGKLIFDDAVSDFWAQSILVQNHAFLWAGTADGTNISPVVGPVTIHLWGKDNLNLEQKTKNTGIPCVAVDDTHAMPSVTEDPQCGVPDSIWTNTNTAASCTPTELPGGVSDCFYPYMAIDYDDANPHAYFGSKVLGVSYGGTLRLYGKRGATYPTSPTTAKPDPLNAADSGKSWARLNKELASPYKTVVLDRVVQWQQGDWIVVSSTDYLPGHAEQVQIAAVSSTTEATTLTLASPLQYPHNATPYAYRSKLPSSRQSSVGPADDPLRPNLKGSIETRAAVGLLTRSIRIVSEGDDPNTQFPAESTHYFYGGHTMFRQGFQAVHIQGVEFYQMGQGGRIMHYPVHFHMARKTPASTFVKDSSIWDSMTRWITLHASQGVTLSRNVGYKSIGHGFYLEDGTETDNKLYSNLGVFARAAVQNPQNPRNVPGILSASRNGDTGDNVPYYTDADHPTVFWIMNGWNDFEYNQASGAGTCGMCYWLVPGYNSGMSNMEHWTSYASSQEGQQNASKTPLQKFVGNACSSAQNSFITISGTTPCSAVVNADPKLPSLPPVQNPLAPPPVPSDYYPNVDTLGGRFATKCPAGALTDCSATPRCAFGGANNIFEDGCMVTVLDHYTSSFTWAQTNFSAMWLRPQWYLVSNSAITDVQNGGLTFVSGGGYSWSDEIPGYWALAYRNAFVGNTQPNTSLYAGNAGPFNPTTFALPQNPLKCALKADQTQNGTYCLNVAEGVVFPLDGFAVNQRFFNIYDGPSYQDSNAYFDISRTSLANCVPHDGIGCAGKGWMYGNTDGILQDQNPGASDKCYQPNAAIGWKQPNGFYYPPAFHSTNLAFSGVEIRHFVIEPLFLTYYQSDSEAIKKRYCTGDLFNLFTGFTDVDRQTELTDDDGSLTGLLSADSKTSTTGPTISVNQDQFFTAPLASANTRECSSDINTFPKDPINAANPGTALTSAYDYLTTVVFPACGYPGDIGSCKINPGDPYPYWGQACDGPYCAGVPLYRYLLLPSDDPAHPPFIRMAGQAIYQRSSLTVNHGDYYIDTTVSPDNQSISPFSALHNSLFKGGQTYYLFDMYAKSNTRQTFRIWVDDPDGKFTGADSEVYMVRANQGNMKISDPNAYPWPATWTKSYKSNILTVTMDMSGFQEFSDNYTKAAADRCKPKNFCTAGGTVSAPTCSCALDKASSGFSDCDHACSNWAMKDVNCPDGGCYGFAIVFPDKFDPHDQGTPVKPDLAWSCNLKKTNTDWNNITFTPAGKPGDTALTGKCTYTTVPVPQYCP